MCICLCIYTASQLVSRSMSVIQSISLSVCLSVTLLEKIMSTAQEDHLRLRRVSFCLSSEHTLYSISSLCAFLALIPPSFSPSLFYSPFVFSPQPSHLYSPPLPCLPSLFLITTTTLLSPLSRSPSPFPCPILSLLVTAWSTTQHQPVLKHPTAPPPSTTHLTQVTSSKKPPHLFSTLPTISFSASRFHLFSLFALSPPPPLPSSLYFTVMLSAESAAGKYPVESVTMQQLIINKVEVRGECSPPT